jgi:NADH dehydrogenase
MNARPKRIVVLGGGFAGLWSAVGAARKQRGGCHPGLGQADGTSTVVWCAGMEASPLTRVFPLARDRSGRIPVDEFMRVEGVEGVFAAGDGARAMLEDSHASVMSCQHGRPMGRFAGHDAVADLLGQPMLPLHIDWYVTLAAAAPVVETAPPRYH